MAGDIGVAETVVLAPTVAPAFAALAPAQAGPVLHEYGPTLRIGIGAASATAAAMAATPGLPAVLTPNEQLGLAALKLRESAAYRTGKNQRRFEGRPWGKGRTPLHRAERPVIKPPQDRAGRAALAAAAPFTARPRRFAGRIAVGIIMVSGPGARALKKNQQVKIAAEVQNGLSWIAAQSPARDVTFVHDNHHLTVTVPQATGPTGDANARYEHFERPWRDAALAQLGFGPGLAGVRAYIGALQQRTSADAAYCAFFTLYRVNHFAYCADDYLVMHYNNDSWGIDNIDRVFAHESGHVVDAPDEYADSGCNCTSRFGFFRKANRNCEDCAPGGGVACIMKENDWAMCSVTPYHFGYNGLPANPPQALAPHVV